MGRRYRFTRLRYALLSGAAAACVIAADFAPATASAASLGGTASGGTAAPVPVTDPASLVNPLIGTTGGGNVFPGPDMPFGMIQWSPDTAPSRPDGGGYSYTAGQITGYGLTHLSGPGCGAYGDVPILPTTGAVGANPGPRDRAAPRSADTLVLVSSDGPVAEVMVHHRNVIRAARDSGVARNVALSGLDADPSSPFCCAVSYGCAEQSLAGSGCPVSIARAWAAVRKQWTLRLVRQAAPGDKRSREGDHRSAAQGDCLVRSGPCR
jgi:hypothetical protein